MSDQFEYDKMGKVPFRDILNAAMPAIRVKPFIDIDIDELKVYAGYIQYKVQRDLFELAEEAAPGTIDWENFILMMRGKKELRDICIDVIGQKLENAFFQYDFASQQSELFKHLDKIDGDMIRGARLFSDEDGALLVGLFLYFAEQTHFNHLRETIHPDYKWEEYRLDLQRNHELWMEVLTAFRNTILGLDFKEIWENVDFDFK